MRSKRAKATIAAAMISAAIASGAWMGGALSSTQAGPITSPGRHDASLNMTGPRRGEQALNGRKAGKEQQEYFVALNMTRCPRCR